VVYRLNRNDVEGGLMDIGLAVKHLWDNQRVTAKDGTVKECGWSYGGRTANPK
jgi:hypothetical protein